MRKLGLIMFCIGMTKVAFGQHPLALVKACGIDTFFTTMIVAESSQMSAATEKICRKLLYTNGQQNATIYLGNSNNSFVSYAVCGMTGDGVICILVNEAAFEGQKFTGKMKFTFIAHELGHINHFHLVKKADLDSTDELNADFYSGFCSAREGYSEDESIHAFSLLHSRLNDIHPPFDRRRTRILQGYQQVKAALLMSDSSVQEKDSLKLITDQLRAINANSESYADTTYSDLLKQYIDAICLIKPLNFSLLKRRRTKWFDVSLSIQSKTSKMPNDTLMSFIKKVTYLLHESFPGNRLKECADSSLNFKYSIPPTWGDFDIPIIITFKDDSVASIVYKLRLKPKTEEEKHDPNGILSHLK